MKRAAYRNLEPRRRSAHTELQWVSGSDESAPGSASRRGDFATVDPELGGRDWASIDPQPVRKSRGVRHGFTPAEYFWQRTGSHIWCESQEERWELLWLDYGGQVDLVWSQALIINFGKGSKLSGESHVPDFLTQLSDGEYALWDVRPRDRISSHAKVQFDETAKVCRNLGWHYEVLSGHDPRATKNLNCIAASRHDRCKPSPYLEGLILTAARRGETRAALCAIAAPDCPPIAAAWVDNLAWRRLLTVDLAAPMSSDTIYTTAMAARLELRSA